MNYYRDLVTEKSWQLLQSLTKAYKFVLIGGWAVWIHTKRLKSKDIDIAVDFGQLELLRRQYQIYKNNRLQKYEAVKGEVQIDIYVPHWSQLGIPVEQILDKAIIKEGFKVPPPEMLLVTKQVAHQVRQASSKGRKDLVDIVSLLLLGEFDFNSYIRWAKLKNIDLAKELLDLITEQKEIPELNLNRRQLAKLKKKWRAELNAL